MVSVESAPTGSALPAGLQIIMTVVANEETRFSNLQCGRYGIFLGTVLAIVIGTFGVALQVVL